MNIREMEQRTGLERANIRYYEKEGLLKPNRQANGYRDYCEADVETLLRIKLLRELEISVTEIAQLQTNDAVLQEVISSRLEKLKKERASLARECKVCETIQSDGVAYDTLKAERYLNQLEDLRQQDWGVDPAVGWGNMTEHLKEDVAPPDLRPDERSLARSVDSLLYFVLWFFFQHIVCGVPFSWDSKRIVWYLVFPFLLQIMLEPTQLAFFGTTVGKYIIGMRVHTEDGEKLDWWMAWRRTWMVIWKSSCMFSTRYWHRKAYGDYWPYNKEKGFPWDEETSYSFRDEKPWRLPIAVACIVGLLLLPGIIATGSQRLKHQGPMTVAEFAENYNKYASIQGNSPEYVLNPQGQWVKASNGVAYIYVFAGEEARKSHFPQFVFTEEEGYLMGISFEVDREGEEVEWLSGGVQNMVNVVMAYAVPLVGHQSPALLEAEIWKNHMHSHSFELGDLTISWNVRTSGYSYNEQMKAYQRIEYPFDFDYAYHMTFEIKPTK